MTMRSKESYSKVAGIWSLLFAIFAIFLLLFPAFLAETITTIGNTIGLNGKIEALPYSLFHVLALSLMGMLSVAAGCSSRFPFARGYLKAIVFAKLISVVGFLLLAYYSGAVWLVCALTDAFVALTFIVTVPPLRWQEHSAFLRKKFSSPSYEVWFGKIDIAVGKALWFRYTTLNGVRQEASVWAIYFDEQQVKTGKMTWPLHYLAPPNEPIIHDSSQSERFSNQPQVFHIGDQHLDAANACGDTGAVKWDLEFEGEGKTFEHVPPLVKLLGVAKSTYNACFIDIRFSGTIKVDESLINISNRPGMIGHISGSKSAEKWAWAHCNQFTEGENIIFEGLSGCIRKGKKVSSPLTSLILMDGDQVYSFSSTRHMLKTKSVFGNGEWSFEADGGEWTLKGTATSPGRVALVKYTDTDNSNQWCYNSKLANLTLELRNTKTGETRNYRAERTAAFEIVNRVKPAEQPDL